MTILIVEDERAVADQLEKGLQARGWLTERAADGAVALDLLGRHEYDLVLLDWGLPQFSGLEVLQQVRSDGDRTPILVLTTRSSVTDRVTALNAGADDYLMKPFALEEVTARVRALTRRGPELVPRLLSLADLTLDPDRRLVTRRGHPLNLTHREYQILEYLLRRPDRVCTRQMIGEHVWGFEFDLMSNVIDVHVGRLRRKLEKGFDRRLLHTVRDVGYSLHE